MLWVEPSGSLSLHSKKLFHGTHVRFVITRFGNVVGSKGSVFHKFLRQIENRQKITLHRQKCYKVFYEYHPGGKSYYSSLSYRKGFAGLCLKYGTAGIDV